jgi:sugar lactone lactonase YvrE
MARFRTGMLAAGLVLLLAAPAAAHRSPDVLPLPTGFQPEGIDVAGHQYYVGSIPTGAVWRGDIRTGEGAILVAPQPGRAATGVEVDRRGRLWVAGAGTGQAYVYDANTGAALTTYTFAPTPNTFINDVVVTRRAAWFTDSLNAVLYRVPIGRDGALGSQQDVTTVSLTGDFTLAPGFNVNGIDATRDGRTLIIVQTNTGKLFRVSSRSGRTDEIELAGGDVKFGDGILLDRRRLYVVQNQLNRIAVVKLGKRLRSGRIAGYITDPDLDVPTTIADRGRRLYAVNARFGLMDPATTYSVAVLKKPHFRHHR